MHLVLGEQLRTSIYLTGLKCQEVRREKDTIWVTFVDGKNEIVMFFDLPQRDAVRLAFTAAVMGLLTLPTAPTCPECEGTGRSAVTDDLPCPVCHGTGLQPSGEEVGAHGDGGAAVTAR